MAFRCRHGVAAWTLLLCATTLVNALPAPAVGGVVGFKTAYVLELLDPPFSVERELLLASGQFADFSLQTATSNLCGPNCLEWGVAMPQPGGKVVGTYQCHPRQIKPVQAQAHPEVLIIS